VNYLGSQIKEFMTSYPIDPIDLEYLEEDRPLGTAGSIIYAGQREKDPIVVVNGDILCDIDFTDLLHFHEKNKAVITIATNRYEIANPYGVINTNDADEVQTLVEKPVAVTYVNAGIYVISPNALSELNAGDFMDMTDLIEIQLANKRKVMAYKKEFFWNDVGTPSDLKRLNFESGMQVEK
jgi:NDP-sugar pyrophosphorylase family protein